MMSTKLDSYTDIKSVLDTAVKAGGGKFVLTDPGQATRWRQRAYYFRQLWNKHNPEDKRYDGLLLRIAKETPRVVEITISHLVGKLYSQDGTLLETKTEPTKDDFKRATERALGDLDLGEL